MSGAQSVAPACARAAEAAGPGAPRQPRVLLAASALTAAALLWACYFPLGWAWLAWIALTPLLCLVRARAGRRVYFYSWVAGLLFYFATLQWLRVADARMYATWFALAVYCSLYFPVFVWAVRKIDRRTGAPLVLSAPAVWTALEFARAYVLGGFAWYYLAHSQHQALAVVQVADVTGAYGVSFLVVAVNAVLFECFAATPSIAAKLKLRSHGKTHIRRRLVLSLVCVAGALAGTLAYGVWRLGQDGGKPGPRLALLQGNIDQRIRNKAWPNGSDTEAEEALATIEHHYDVLRQQAAGQKPPPDLMVWPETSLPFAWEELGSEFPHDQLHARWVERIEDARHRGKTEPWPELVSRWLNERAAWEAKRAGTSVLFGLSRTVYQDRERQQRYNSAVLLDAQGQVRGSYDKMHRVPFGEYVPLREVLPWMEKLAPYDYDYSIRAGERATRFSLGPYSFGVLICYEDTDPDLARGYGRPSGTGRPVDFLVNISNDGWFDGTSEHDQHLAIARFRAIECRRALARAVNMGISAVIDGSGRVVALPGATWKESKKVAAVLTASVPIDERVSLYCRWGDWFAWTCVAASVCALGAAVLAGSKRSVPARA